MDEKHLYCCRATDYSLWIKYGEMENRLNQPVTFPLKRPINKLDHGLKSDGVTGDA